MDYILTDTGALNIGLILLVLGAGFLAGWVDSVVGGGGLIQLPVVLLIPGLSPVQALATNKVGSIFGTTTSAITYGRRVRPDLATSLGLAVTAGLASVGGAVVASVLPTEVFKPIILLALIVVFIFTLAKKNMGSATVLKHASMKHHGRAWAIGAAIGFYDGVLGPGTGSFLVIALVGILGYSFLDGSARAKIANWATNFGALCFFIPAGHVVWPLGIALGIANMFGGYIGSRMAVSAGSRFVRIVFLVVVTALIMRVGADTVRQFV